MREFDGYRRGQVVADLLLVASVPVGLAAIHLLLPASVKDAYALYPGTRAPLTLFTAAFLHVNVPHLFWNVVGYLLGALSAYLLCLLLFERRWFWLSTLALLFGLPALLNWTSLQVLRLNFGDVMAPIRGFSGVAAAFGGFAFSALLAYVSRRTDRWTAFYSGLAVLLALLWEVLVIYAENVPASTTGLVALGVGLCALEIGRRRYRTGLPRTRTDWVRTARVLVVFAWTLSVLAVLISGFFPARIVVDGRFINVFAHAIGLGYGFVITGWGYRYWRTGRTGGS